MREPDRATPEPTEAAAGVDAELAYRARRVTRTDWDWISRWYRDPELNHRLGPLDATWLEHVLTEHEGAQLVIENTAGTPVALVGCVWDSTGTGHAITDLAVDPKLRRHGIGRRALAAVLSWQGHPRTQRWTAFVEPENLTAFDFFTAIGWAHAGLTDGMHRFDKTP